MPELKNLKHELFCQEYSRCLNGKQAILNTPGFTAGPNGAHVSANKLLQRATIQERITELVAIRAQKAAIHQDDVLILLKEIANRCMQKVPVLVYDPIIGQMVQKMDEEGNSVWTFNAVGAAKAAELIGKHVGLFEKDNLQKSNKIIVQIVDDDEELTQDDNVIPIDNFGNNSQEGFSQMLPSPTG